MSQTTPTINRTTLGRTALSVFSLCVGTAAWGLTSPVHGLSVTEAEATATVHAALRSPVNFIDTSNNYGDGESERRIGVALASVDAPEDFIVQTKLDRDPETGSFGADRMRRSLDESLERLGLTHLPLLHLHDPENISFDEAMSSEGPVSTLIALRDEGYADHIGISGGPATLLKRFVETDIFDVLITHNRFTLVDQTADELLTAAATRGLGIINAAVYGGGILSTWPRTSDHYHYRTAPSEVLGAIDSMGAACARYGIPLIAAALQLSTRDPRIHSTICGMVSAAQLHETLTLLDVTIPPSLWEELAQLRPDRSTWIND
ncbi:aldo/keto reductase [Microbacterium sp. A84]|uniref:aldo/keto reductase n=1 Tax=Microbacterium sp. A84 TaxID=3450715 RepID=UPI003F42C6E1